jgi:hypothetical protein
VLWNSVVFFQLQVSYRNLDLFHLVMFVEPCPPFPSNPKSFALYVVQSAFANTILTRCRKFAFDARHHNPSHVAKNFGQLDPLVLAHGLYLVYKSPVQSSLLTLRDLNCNRNRSINILGPQKTGLDRCRPVFFSLDRFFNQSQSLTSFDRSKPVFLIFLKR